MLDDLELSLMAFPQSWTKATGTLAVNLIVLPVGDPTGPVGSVPVFAGTTLKLTAQLLTGGALLSTIAASAATSYAHSHIATVVAAGGTQAARHALVAHAAIHGYTTGFAVSAGLFVVGMVVGALTFERRVPETDMSTSELVLAH